MGTCHLRPWLHLLCLRFSESPDPPGFMAHPIGPVAQHTPVPHRRVPLGTFMPRARALFSLWTALRVPGAAGQGWRRTWGRPALAAPSWTLTFPHAACWEEGGDSVGGRGEHEASGRVSIWLCLCAQSGHQQPGITAPLHLLGLVHCLPQLHSCCILAMISACPSPALSFQILPWRRQEMREKVSKEVVGEEGRTVFRQVSPTTFLLWMLRDTWCFYEHRLCSWLWVCPWAGCVTAFLNCKMGVEVMPTSQVALCRAHVQPAGNQAQLLLSPVTGVCSD